MQVKAHVPDEKARAVEETLAGPDFAIGKSSQRRQYDTYFVFHDKWASRIRYREDEVLTRDALGVEPVLEGQASADASRGREIVPREGVPDSTTRPRRKRRKNFMSGIAKPS